MSTFEQPNIVASVIRLATLNAVTQQSDSEEFYLAGQILNSFGIKIDQAIEKYEAEEHPEPPTQPHPIDGPGWYQAENGDRIIINRQSGSGFWIGEVENKTRHQVWRPDGRHADDYGPWMIVAKEA